MERNQRERGRYRTIENVNDAAKYFLEDYYGAMNRDRTKLASLYVPDAKIVYNGNAFAGGDAFASFFATATTTYHDSQSYDVHKVGGGSNLMVLVSGAVKYGIDKVNRGYSETFVLQSIPGPTPSFKIQSQVFRLVTK